MSMSSREEKRGGNNHCLFVTHKKIKGHKRNQFDGIVTNKRVMVRHNLTCVSFIALNNNNNNNKWKKKVNLYTRKFI